VPEDIDHDGTPRRVVPTVENPHWQASKCNMCHREESGRFQPIAPRDVDAGCLVCHDGVKAVAESHPVGWPAAGPRTQTPDGWPLNDGRIGCLTCHDIRKHCDSNATRPELNSALVRGYDPRDQTASCRNCHVGSSMRVNPHLPRIEGLPGTGATCTFCHAGTPAIEPGPEVRVDPRLRGESTSICLGCHAMHADPAPEGHLRRTVPAEILARIEKRRAAAGGTSRRLPLDNNRVTCSTCHNPHAANYDTPAAPDDSPPAPPVGAPADMHKLRLDPLTLCAYCHGE
jgi:hypothetical protein